jgi:hypothetical protein
VKSKPSKDPEEIGRRKRRFERLVEGHKVLIWVFEETGDYSFTWSCHDLYNCFGIGRAIFDTEAAAMKFAIHKAAIAIRAHQEKSNHSQPN